MVEYEGLEGLLSINIDKYGEFIHEPFTESLRVLTASTMTQIRN